MEDLIRKFPEFEIILESKPMSMLLEGGAEVAVDLIYPIKERKKSLANLLKGKKINIDVDLILEVERLTWKESWNTIIFYAKKYIDKEISKEELIILLNDMCFKANNSWPNADFIESSRAYIQSYGWGRELIVRYLKSIGKYSWEGYVEFMKRPVAPSNMQSIINSVNLNK